MAHQCHPQEVESWYQDWFDEDYAELYAGRDAAEAEGAVATALSVLPELMEGPVLDLACGSGRHLEALRRANPLAFGIDLSPSLLARAPASLRPWLLRGDMRSLPLPFGSLAGICLWFTPFGYFGDRENRDLMRSLASRLRPGGVLWLDYLNSLQAIRDLPAEEIQEKGDLRVQIRKSLEGTRIVKRMSILRNSTGDLREALESVRLYLPEEMEELAGPSGLRLERNFGNYDAAPFHPESPRWIGVFRKPGGPAESPFLPQ